MAAQKDKLIIRVSSVLDVFAVQGTPKPYGIITKAVGHVPNSGWMRPCYEATVDRDLARGVPLRASLAINEASGFPNRMFFDYVEGKLGKPFGNDRDRADFLLRQWQGFGVKEVPIQTTATLMQIVAPAISASPVPVI